MFQAKFGVWTTSRRRVSSRIVRRFVQIAARLFREVGMVSLSKKIDHWLAVARDRWKSQLASGLDLMFSSGQGDCFIDLGAHIGEQSLVAAEFMPVYAFEPDPVAVEKLKKNVSVGSQKNEIVVIQKAATKFDGVTEFYGSNRGRMTTGSSSLVDTKKNVIGGEVYMVETCDIGRFISDLPFRKFIIKCDVEGAEYEVIESLGVHCVFDRVILMFTEFHDSKIPGQWRKSLKLSLWNRRKWDVKRGQLVEWI